jgi:hypothetical protein
MARGVASQRNAQYNQTCILPYRNIAVLRPAHVPIRRSQQNIDCNPNGTLSKAEMPVHHLILTKILYLVGSASHTQVLPERIPLMSLPGLLVLVHAQSGRERERVARGGAARKVPVPLYRFAADVHHQ